MSAQPQRQSVENRFLICSGALCLLGISWAVFEYMTIARMRAALTATETQVVVADARAAALKQSEQKELQQSAELKRSFDQLANQIATSAPPVDRYAKGRQFLADHPEARQMIHDYKQALAHSWPMTSGRAAGFSEEQLNQYASRFARQKGVAFSVGDVELPDDEGTLTTDEAQGSGLKALVGPDLYARYQSVQEQLGGDTIAASVAQAAHDFGTPLTSEQSQALLPWVTGEQQKVDWDTATQQAMKILTPEQLSAWNAEKQLWQNQLAPSAYAQAAIDAARSTSP